MDGLATSLWAVEGDSRGPRRSAPGRRVGSHAPRRRSRAPPCLAIGAGASVSSESNWIPKADPKAGSGVREISGVPSWTARARLSTVEGDARPPTRMSSATPGGTPSNASAGRSSNQGNPSQHRISPQRSVTGAFPALSNSTELAEVLPKACPLLPPLPLPPTDNAVLTHLRLPLSPTLRWAGQITLITLTTLITLIDTDWQPA